MPVSVPDDLYARLIEALPYGDERDALMALTQRPNAEASVTITVPERLAAHFAHSLSLGAATAMMCSAHPESVRALRDASDQVKALIPAVFSAFLHESDAEKAMDMLVFGGGVARADGRWNTAKVIIARPGKKDWAPLMNGIRDLPKEEAERIVAGLNDFAERCRVSPEALAEKNDLDACGL